MKHKKPRQKPWDSPSKKEPSKYFWKLRFCPALGYATDATDFRGNMIDGMHVSNEGAQVYLIDGKLKGYTPPPKAKAARYTTEADIIGLLERTGRAMSVKEINKEIGQGQHSKPAALRKCIANGRVIEVGRMRHGNAVSTYYGLANQKMVGNGIEEDIEKALEAIKRLKCVSMKELAATLKCDDSRANKVLREMMAQDLIWDYSTGAKTYYELAAA